MLSGDDIDLTQGNVRVQVKGLRKTLRALEGAGVASEDITGLMRSVGDIVVRKADVPLVTGRLVSTLRVGNGKTKSVVRVGGARAPYAPKINWYKTKLYPEGNQFLMDSLRRSQGEIFTTLDEGISRILKRYDLN